MKVRHSLCLHVVIGFCDGNHRIEHCARIDHRTASVLRSDSRIYIEYIVVFHPLQYPPVPVANDRPIFG